MDDKNKIPTSTMTKQLPTMNLSINKTLMCANNFFAKKCVRRPASIQTAVHTRT